MKIILKSTLQSQFQAMLIIIGKFKVLTISTLSSDQLISKSVVLNLWYVYHWWYLSPPLVVFKGVSPCILTLWWYLERLSEMVLGVKRLRPMILNLLCG